MTTIKTSFLALLLTIFLLPIFFIPGGLIPPALGQTLIVLIGLAIVGGAFLVGILKKGEVVLPWHPVFIVVIALPLIYLFSGLHAPRAGLFGSNLEVGTFVSVLLGVLLLLVIPMLVRDKSSLLKLLSAAALSGILA